MTRRPGWAATAAGKWASGFAVGWLALSSSFILADQVHQLPPRKPTPEERRAATPGAQARWRTVYRELAPRLPDRPPEFGAVWASRSGRVCGVATRRNAGVYFRERFYTDEGAALFSADDERRFMRVWVDCVGDHWVELKVGSDKLGFCAVPRNQTSAIAHFLCRPDQLTP